MKKLKTLFLLSLLMLLGLQAVSLLYPPAVFAAATGTWESRSVIKIGDVAYFDNKTDRTYNHRRQGDPEPCVDEIDDIRENNTKATLFVKTPSAANQKNCTVKKETINLSSPEKSYIFFVWNNKTTIATSDQANTYNLRDDGIFYEAGGDECKDSIYDFSSKTSAKLIARTNGDETSFTKNGNTAYQDGPNAMRFNNPKRQDGCVVYDPVKIAITAEQNATGQPGTTSPVGGKLENDTQDDNSCESLAAPLGWILCPVILLLDNGLELIDTQIKNLLVVDANQFNNDGMRNASAAIRNLAYIIMIPIMLIMVIGTAIGSDFVSAYTVKKALPRLVVAVIFISLSFPLLTFAVSATNDIGSATLSFITYPFGNNVGGLSLADLYSAPTSGGGGYLTAIIHAFPKLIGAAVTALGLIAVLWFFGTTILLFAGVGFLVLMIRQMFIVLLILLAPLAILAWIFPGNDKLWKSWWGLFSKLLIMFPLIMALIASGRIFAWIINEGNSGSFTGDIVAPIGKLIAYMLPYAMIPLTFKFAGGIFSQIAGFVDNKEKGIFDRQRQNRAKKLERTANQKMFKNAPLGSFRGRLNTAGASAMNARRAGANPLNWRRNIGGALTDNSLAQRDAMMEDKEWTYKNDDDLNRAAAESHNATSLRDNLMEADRRRIAAGGSARYAGPDGHDNMQRDIARVENMRRKYGNSAFRQASWMKAVAGGTSYQGADAWQAAAAIAGGNSAILSDLVGQGKGMAMAGGRVDQGGAGFGDITEIATRSRSGWTDQKTGEHYTGQRYVASGMADKHLAEAVFKASGPASLTHPSMKPQAVKNMVPEMQRRLKDAVDSGNQDRIDRELAFSASVYDTLNATSPQLAEIIGDQVLRWKPAGSDAQQLTPVGVQGPVAPGGGDTVQAMIEDRRNTSDVFVSTRREYGRQADAARKTEALRESTAPGVTPGGPPANNF